MLLALALVSTPFPSLRVMVTACTSGVAGDAEGIHVVASGRWNYGWRRRRRARLSAVPVRSGLGAQHPASRASAISIHRSSISNLPLYDLLLHVLAIAAAVRAAAAALSEGDTVVPWQWTSPMSLAPR